MLVYQDTSGASADSLPEDVTAAQLELQDLAATEISGTDHFVFAPASSTRKVAKPPARASR